MPEQVGQTPEQPFLSIVVPVRNEERYLRQTLELLLAQEYPPDRFEILVVDGESTDGTAHIAAEMARRHPQVRLLKNSGRLSSAGRNVGLREARGEYVVFVDGHVYLSDRRLFASIAECFRQTGADCLSRPQPLFTPRNTPQQNAIAAARHSWFGHGLGSRIYAREEGWVDPTSAGAVYRREVFEQVGGYDEEFDACEDVEFNFRVKQAGLRCFTRPDLAVHYYPRETFSGLFRQMCRYGVGRTRLVRKHPGAFGLGQLAPLVVWAGTLAGLLAGFFVKPILLLVGAGWALYGLASLAALLSAPRTLSSRERVMMAVALPIIHAGLAWGWIRGWIPGWLSRWKSPTRLKKVTAGSGGSRLRILYLIDEMEAITAGGTERQVLQMIRLVRQAGLAPELCVLRGTRWLSEEQVGCPVHFGRLGTLRSPRGLVELCRLVAWMRRRRFHIAQTFFVEANLWGPLLARLARVPVVLGSRRNLNYWMSSLMAKVQWVSNLLATRLIANCEAVKKCVMEREKVNPAKVDVLHNGIDTDRFVPDADRRKKVRAKLGLSEAEILVGNVSVLRPIKGVEHFLVAASLVAAESPAARFLVVGEGPLRPWLERMIGRLGLQGCFWLVGSQEDVLSYLNACDIAVLSSDSEGFANSILEYMAVGLPCVATDVGGNREVLGEAGSLLVPPANAADLAEALLGLIHDPDRRQTLSTAARRRARQHFSLDQTQERLVHYYRRWFDREEARDWVASGTLPGWVSEARK